MWGWVQSTYSLKTLEHDRGPRILVLLPNLALTVALLTLAVRP